MCACPEPVWVNDHAFPTRAKVPEIETHRRIHSRPRLVLASAVTLRRARAGLLRRAGRRCHTGARALPLLLRPLLVAVTVAAPAVVGVMLLLLLLLHAALVVVLLLRLHLLLLHLLLLLRCFALHFIAGTRRAVHLRAASQPASQPEPASQPASEQVSAEASPSALQGVDTWQPI